MPDQKTLQGLPAGRRAVHNVNVDVRGATTLGFRPTLMTEKPSQERPRFTDVQRLPRTIRQPSKGKDVHPRLIAAAVEGVRFADVEDVF